MDILNPKSSVYVCVCAISPHITNKELLHTSCSMRGTCCLSHVRLFATPRTVAHQALLSMKFPRQEYWSRLSFPTPEDLPNPGIEPGSPTFFTI